MSPQMDVYSMLRCSPFSTLAHTHTQLSRTHVCHFVVAYCNMAPPAAIFVRNYTLMCEFHVHDMHLSDNLPAKLMCPYKYHVFDTHHTGFMEKLTLQIDVSIKNPA